MPSPDLSNLVAYPGEYQQVLIDKLYNELSLEKEGIVVMPGIKSKENMHKMLVKKGAKPYTGKFIAKDNDVTFEPRVLEVLKAQRDLTIEPSKYLNTFMQNRRGRGEHSNNTTIPFAEHMWNEVMKELATEINTETVYHGVGKAAFAAYNAGTVYNPGDLITYTQEGELRYFRCVTVTTAGQNPDTHPAKWEWAGARAITKGFGKIITDEITAGNLTATAIGAVNSTNAYAKFMQLWRAQPEPVKLGKVGLVDILCSVTDYECLTDDYEDKIKKNFEEVDGVTYLAKTNRVCRIKPVSWLTGSRRLICTPVGNLIAGTDELSDMNGITAEKHHYVIESTTSFMIGFQFRDLEVLKVGDQA